MSCKYKNNGRLCEIVISLLTADHRVIIETIAKVVRPVYVNQSSHFSKQLDRFRY